MANRSLPITSPLMLDQVLDEAGVKRFNVMFITGRCGSTWLAESLSAGGEVGKGDELFNQDLRPQLMGEFGFDPWYDRESLVQVLRARSPRGVLWVQAGDVALDFLTRHVVSLPALASERVILSELDRRDRLGQALSFVKAERTGRWSQGESPDARMKQERRSFVADLEQLTHQLSTWLVAIRSRVDAISAYKARFAALGKGCNTWFYEDLLGDPARSHLEVAAFLLGATPQERPRVQVLGKQRTSTDTEFLRQLTAAVPELYLLHEARLGCRAVSFAIEALRTAKVTVEPDSFEGRTPLDPPQQV